jgi:hypothetical protein
MASRRIRGYVLRINGFSQKFFTEGNEAYEATEAIVSVRQLNLAWAILTFVTFVAFCKRTSVGWCRRFIKNRPVRTAITAFGTKIEAAVVIAPLLRE